VVDVVVPAHEKDFPVLRHTVTSVLRHISPLRRLHVVSATPFEHRDARVRWVDERSITTLPSLAEVEERWDRDNELTAGRGSWVYQQLLKLGAGRYLDDPPTSHLVVDADLTFLRPVSFDPEAVGRFPYSVAEEYHEPYAWTHERLFGTPPTVFSLTAHHMLYDPALLEEMFSEIEDRHGLPWYWAYLDAVDRSLPSSVSEMDIYGPWVVRAHPELAHRRQLQWRNARGVPGVLGRALLAADFDFVAAHAWYRQPRRRRAGDFALRVAAEVVAPLKARWTSS
jgi:hypothetical protein